MIIVGLIDQWLTEAIHTRFSVRTENLTNNWVQKETLSPPVRSIGDK